MNRVYNFSAGPSMLPLSVLERAASELICYGDSGMSVMEMSHRSKVYQGIFDETQEKFRKLMGVPEGYKVLFLQGGATMQFAMVPMNLMTKTGKADYVRTGNFANAAHKEAKKYGDVRLVATSEETVFDRIPAFTKEDIRPDADYVHICFNNTIYGTKFNYIPDTGDIPLVADISSCILSEPLDVSKFGVLFAGAQKNLAPAGVTLVIIREDLISEETLEKTPTMLSYKIHADADSMYNTPPCYTIYVMGKVLEWIERNGGAEGMKKRNDEKANLLYDMCLPEIFQVLFLHLIYHKSYMRN